MKKTTTILQMVTAGLALLASCAPSNEALKCRRLETVSMGPENALATSVAAGARIDDPADGIDAAIVVVPPWTGPVRLVQKVDGREVARWEIAPPASTAFVHRCKIATTRTEESCGEITGASFAIAGQWSVDPLDNRVLEASVAFRLCD